MITEARHLSEEDKLRIHGESLRVLSEVGIRFPSKRALDILKRGGAIIDETESLARIPEEMVNEAVRLAPKSFILGARDPERDFELPAKRSGTVLDNGGIFTLDFNTGARRPCRIADLHNFNRVYEYSKWSNIVWSSSFEEGGLPGNESLVDDIMAFFSTSCHIQGELLEPEDTAVMVEALKIICGSEDEIRRRHPYSVVYCTIPPLSHDADMCEAYLEMLPLEIPICIYPMPAAGSTGPASLFANTVVSNAEALSALVLFQTARPGTPCFFGSAVGTTNLRNGLFLEGSPGMVVMSAACGEMARFYGLPNEQAGCLTEAKDHGAQAIMEKMGTTLPLVLSGADLVQGPGALETSNCMSLEQIVVDDELFDYCQQLRRGVDCSEEKSLFDDIKSCGPGGHYLAQLSTVEACRSEEFFKPRLADSETFEVWNEAGRQGMYDRARQRVEEILSRPVRMPLPDDVQGKLMELMKADSGLKI